jgi:ADP-L-glycero-D-manno-heptose 6-epimerase
MWILTGANGFIGSALLSELNTRGIKDLLITDSVRPEERPDLLRGKNYANFLHTDELFIALEDAALSSNIRGVIHMGACSDTTEMDVEFLRANNTEYTQRLFEFCTQQKIPLIYASSGAVYGSGKEGFSDQHESAVFTPLNPYGWSKLNFDVWAEKQKETPPVWYGLRFFNVYGPNEYFKGAMASLVFKAHQQILETGKLKLFRSHNKDYENGKQLRDFVYVKDITRWICELMDQRPAKSGIYNMGYGKARTWLDLAGAVFKALNKELKIEWIDIPANIRDQYQYFTEARMEKLFSEGLSQPQWDVEKGVSDYVKNYLSQGPKIL